MGILVGSPLWVGRLWRKGRMAKALAECPGPFLLRDFAVYNCRPFLGTNVGGAISAVFGFELPGRL